MSKLLNENINRLWSSLIIDEIIKNDITHFYLSPGMRNAPLIAALAATKQSNKKIEIITCFDERGAAYRALGYAKGSGKPAVLLCTSGTAMANYFPAVIEAKKSSLPIIILTADRPIELTFCDENQTINQSKFYGEYVQGEMNLGAPSFDISPLALTSSISNLIHKSFFPQKGPVHINCPFREPLDSTKIEIPTNYLKLAIEQFKRIGASTRYLRLATTPESSEIEEIIKQLKISQSGMLVIGSLNTYDETSIVKKFINTLKWPTYFDVSSSLKYEFNLNDNTLPTLDHPEVQDSLISNPPDTIFHIGGRLTSKHYYSFLKQVPSINLITLSQNREKEDPSHHTKIRINAHINSTLDKILTHLSHHQFEEKKFHLNFENFTKQKIELIDNGPLAYPSISKSIIDNIEEQAALYIGNSTVVRSFDAYFSYKVKKQLTIATNRGVSGIEGFIASAIGLSEALKRSVYLILGDISFIHDLNSLFLLKNSHYPIKIILINNHSGGIFTLLPVNKDSEVMSYITSPHEYNFDKAAELIEIDYLRANARDEFNQKFVELKSSNKSTIMEVIVDNEINKAVYDKLKTIKL